MTNLTGKFLVVGGVRFVQVADGDDGLACLRCAFKASGPPGCCIDEAAERGQGMDCVVDDAHYEVVQ